MQVTIIIGTKSIHWSVIDCALIALYLLLFKNFITEKIRIAMQLIVAQVIPIRGSKIGPQERKLFIIFFMFII